MARSERIREELSAAFGVDELARRNEQGWKLVAVEWERELPESEPLAATAADVPFGFRIAEDAGKLEADPAEQEVLMLMMELTVEDGPYSAIAEELNRRGYRTRQGMRWTPVSVFQMLPRLIEVGPRIFSTQEWQQRRAKMSAQ